MEKESDSEKGKRGPRVKCTKDNYRTEFLPYLLNESRERTTVLSIISKRIPTARKVPLLDTKKARIDADLLANPGNAAQYAVPNKVPLETGYPDPVQTHNVLEKSAFEVFAADEFKHELKEYKEYKKECGATIRMVMNALDPELETLVKSDPEYDMASETNDLHKMLTLVEQAIGTGHAVNKAAKVMRWLNPQGITNMTVAQMTYAFRNMIMELDRDYPNKVDMLETVTNVLYVSNLERCKDKDMIAELILQQHERTDFEKWDTVATRAATVIKNKTNIAYARDTHKEEGKLEAHVASEKPRQQCFNCGREGHIRKDCRRPSNKCSKCGGNGHLERFCRRKDDNNDNGKTGHEYPKEKYPQSYGEKKNISFKETNGFTRKARAKAHVAQEEEQQDEDYHSIDEQYYDDEYEDIADVVFVDEDNDATQALVATEQSYEFILDSGCNKSHICKSLELMSHTFPTNTNVSGVIAGKSCRTSTKGELGQLGMALHMPEANCNLLSLPVLARKGCSFAGDGTTLVVRDRRGQILIEARMSHKGFWTTSLTKTQLDNSEHSFALTTMDGDGAEDTPQGGILAMDTPPTLIDDDIDLSPRQLTREQIKRANIARNLCAVAGHPNVDELRYLFETGRFTYSHPHIQMEDVINAWRLYGKCSSCTRGKMKAAESTKSSTALPAERVGQVIHMDIVPTPKSLGCEHLLVAIDEKSSYMFSIPMKSKDKAELLRATDSMLAQINQFGHRCDEIRTDHESTIAACKHEWATRSIRHSKHPPYSHAKRIERHIQTVKTIVACNDADLLYIRPSYLDAAAFAHAITLKNMRRHKNTGNFTPHKMFCPNVTAYLPAWSFGQTGLVYNAKYKTSEWGIFVGGAADSGPNGIKVYIKFPVSNGRDGVYVRDKFVEDINLPFKLWNLLPNLNTTRLNAPKMRQDDMTLPTSSALPMPPNTVVQDRPVPIPPPSLSALSQPHVPAPTTPANTILMPETSAPSATPHLAEKGAPSLDSPEKNDTDKSTSPTSDQKGDIVLPLDTLPLVSTASSVPVLSDPVVAISPASTDAPPTRKQRRTAAQITADELTQAEREYLRPAGSGETNRYQTRLRHTTALMKDDEAMEKTTQSYTLDYVSKHPEKFPIEATRNAAITEFLQLIKMNCMTPVYAKDIPRGDSVTVIPAHAICRDKYHADGTFDKLKCRLVCGGHREDPEHAGETKSPTVNPIVVMTVLQEACQMIRQHPTTTIAAYDIKSAFPNTDVEESRHIFIFTTGEANNIWKQIKPEWDKYINNGKMYFKLNKYLYGLKESPARFNNLLNSVILEDKGFKKSAADECLYVKTIGNHKIILCVHVDDILCVSTHTYLRAELEQLLRSRFEIVTQYDNLSYLGMSVQLHKHEGTITVNQTGYIEAIAKRFKLDHITTAPSVPLSLTAFQHKHVGPDEEIAQRKYLSLIMAIMYVARITRPDILFGIVYLSTRTSSCKLSDYLKAKRILKYLVGTKTIAVKFKYVPLREPIKVYADASHNTHVEESTRGHGGLLITVGNSAPIHFRSFKLKTYTRSSSESELLVLDEAGTYLSWLKLLMASLSASPREIKVYQDNLSTMVMSSGKLSFKNSKHLYGKHTNLIDAVKKGDIVIEHLPSKEMLADFLTKPTSRPMLDDIVKKLSLTYL